MWLKNGVLTKGPPPKSNSKTPKVITHHSQRTAIASSGRRLDNVLEGKIRICIYRSLGGLGDIIMSTPISRGAKRKFPNCHVTYAIPADYAGGAVLGILENNPYIDEVIDYKLVNRGDYDSFTDITRIGLSEEKPYTIPSNRIDLFANSAGIPLFGNGTPVYNVTEEEKEWGKRFIQKAVGNKKYKGLIGIHLSSNDPKRSWPTHRIREFVKLAKEAGFFCFLFEWGASSDEWRLAGSETVFDYYIRQAAAILSSMDIIVCPDSMMLHLAGALNMRIVSLFGNMPPSCRINHYPNAIAVVNQQVSCLGCIYAPCSTNYYCMSSLLPQAVLAAVKRQLEKDIDSVEEDTSPIVTDGVFVNQEINGFLI